LTRYQPFDKKISEGHFTGLALKDIMTLTGSRDRRTGASDVALLLGGGTEEIRKIGAGMEETREKHRRHDHGGVCFFWHDFNGRALDGNGNF